MGNLDTSKSREKILAALRASHTPFPDAPPPPADYLPVTRIDEHEHADLIHRFRAELERLKGFAHTPPNHKSAVKKVLEILGDSQSVLTWEKSPLPELAEALAEHNITALQHDVRGEKRPEATAALGPVPFGIVSAEAGFAATGTVVLASGAGQGRITSLMPPNLIILLKRSRLLPRLEDWIANNARQILTESNSVAFVTGPSRTADIEGELILGVHGPGVVHVVIFA